MVFVAGVNPICRVCSPDQDNVGCKPAPNRCISVWLLFPRLHLSIRTNQCLPIASDGRLLLASRDSSKTVLPTPRSPVRTMFSMIIVCSSSFRNSWRSSCRPARYGGEWPAPRAERIGKVGHWDLPLLRCFSKFTPSTKFRQQP